MRWSKKLEMNSTEKPIQRTVLMENIDINSEVSSDVDKMSSHESSNKAEDVLKPNDTELVEGNTDSSQQAMVMNSQYLELERSASAGGHHPGTQVVKVSANGQLVSCEMLQHVGSIDGEQSAGLVVHVLPSGHGDLKQSAAYYASTATSQQLHRGGTLLTEERYLTEQLSSQHYEDDLLGHDISEEDRRIAAALIEVQYSQQQKQQQQLAKLLEPGSIVCTSASEGNVIMSVSDSMQSLISTNQLGKVDPTSGTMSDMVVEYIQQVEGTSSHDPTRKQMRLVAYHPDTQTALHVAPETAAQLHNLENSQLQTHHLKNIVQSPPLLKKALTTQMSPRARYKRSMEEAMQESRESVKNEDDDDPDFLTEDDLDDSDFDIESEARSSRRSLPHKKRIPRKLKNPKKSPDGMKNLKCNKCEETFQTQHALIAHKQVHNNSNKNPFKCEICGKNTPNQLKFFEHLKSHYEPVAGASTADLNDGVTEVPESIKEEQLQHPTVIVQDLPPALPPPLTCPHCAKVFRRQKALEKHITTSHGQVEELEEEEEMEDVDMDNRDLIHEVVDDDDSLKKEEWFTHHELTNVAAVPVQQMMDQEQKLGTSTTTTVLTDISVADLPPIEEQYVSTHLCDHCGESFELKSQLTLHMKEEHPDIKKKSRKKGESTGPASTSAIIVSSDPPDSPDKSANRKYEQLTCPTCGRVFNHRNSLVYHLRSHTGERPHQCDMCGKSFFAASALKVHMRLHSGDKPYKCELCGRHFRQWGDLKYHCISIHTDEKQYQCEFCGKDFARKYSLIVHRRIHTGEKNYKCEFCTKTFRASSYLQNHRRIHTGEKPHPCDVCGKPFRVRSDMKRHMQTHSRDSQNLNSSSVSASHATTHSQSSQSSSQGATEAQHPDLPELDPVAAEITIQDGDREEAAAASAALAQEQDPHTPQQIAEQQIPTGEEVQEEVMQYSRDPLETVRDGTSTLYVWPIYMA